MRFASLVALSTAAIALMGCPSESAPVDTDKTPTLQSPRVPPDLQVDDSIDAKKDKVDFKILQPTASGKATVEVDFGEGHLVQGSLGVYGSDGASSVEEAAITSGEASYKITWDVAEDAIYYLKIAADQGKGGYKVDFSVSAPVVKGPCEDVQCDDGEECQAGKCVELKAPECDPKCKAGLVCINGACEKACGGGCPRGQLCSKTKNECIKDPCFQKQCAAGERCVGGTCRASATPTPTEKECKPACTGGAKCNTKTGACEGGDAPPIDAPPADNCAGPLNGAIVQVLPQGAKTVLVINRGSKVCVKVGQSGKIAGVAGAFTITEVYEFRSKAVIAVDDKAIGANRAVTINR